MPPILCSLSSVSSRGYGHPFSGGVLAPIGLIVPYDALDTPEGWSSFTAANDRHIVGAGGAYSPGSAGGSDTASIPLSFSSSGAHLPSSVAFGASGNSNNTAGNNSVGAHAHTANASANVAGAHRRLRLIKSTKPSLLPSNAMLLGVDALPGLQNVESATNAILRAAASPSGVAGSNTPTVTGTTSDAGAHSHGTVGSRGPQSPASASLSLTGSVGAHTHSISGSGSLALRKRAMSAWRDATKAFGCVPKGIALYESLTPPPGWAICDGSNGTPDMRDFFVLIGDQSAHGEASGNNTIAVTASISFSGSHSHAAGTELLGTVSARHTSFAWSHSHSASASASVLPAYYALAFVQKL